MGVGTMPSPECYWDKAFILTSEQDSMTFWAACRLERHPRKAPSTYRFSSKSLSQKCISGAPIGSSLTSWGAVCNIIQAPLGILGMLGVWDAQELSGTVSWSTSSMTLGNPTSPSHLWGKKSVYNDLSSEPNSVLHANIEHLFKMWF